MTDFNATELTPGVERQITEDWAPFFPGLGVYKPMRLLRRVGPLLIGVGLDRGAEADAYYPKFYTQCLTSDFSDRILPSLCVKLQRTLCTMTDGQVFGTTDFIRLKRHHRRYEVAAGRMKELALLPLSGGLTCRQVIAAYKAGLSRSIFYLGIRERREMTEIAACAGDHRLAVALFEEAGRMVERLPPRLPKNMESLCKGEPPVTPAEWLAALAHRIANPEELRAKVVRRIDELKLRDLPSAPLLHSVEV